MTEASEMDSNTRSGPDRRLDPMALAASASTVAAAVMSSSVPTVRTADST